MFINRHLLWCILPCSSNLVNGLAVPRSTKLNDESILPRQDVAVDAIAGGLPLRIMPLGASITFGEASSDGNGYRSDLRTALVQGGNEVNMVGTQANGTMKDNQSEGWPGFVVDEVRVKADISVPQSKPNLVLINAGTNDCLQNIDIAGASARVQSLLDVVYGASPRAAVVLSTLLVNGDPDAQARTQDFNAQLRTLTAMLQLAGKPITLVDMQSSAGPTLDDLVDGTHPDDAGYQKMANLWLGGIQELGQKRLLQRAEVVSGIPDDGDTA
ncbi:carbohydrate esterase family 3 protein [Xylariaceae sp. FL0662B]|nr:carbohydrate esterase family 3 protein [Xylariaceae sp. FL0662B]